MVLAVDLGQSGARLKSSDSQFTSKRAKQAHESTLDVLNDLFAEAQENFGPDFQSHIFGDLGGGFWLGKAALERVLATQEGRDDATFLSEFFESEIKTYESLKSHTDAKAQLLCISAAKTLLEAAETKNTDAITIRDKGAEYLAKTIRAAWTNVGGMRNEGIAIALLGKLAENKGYVEAIRRRTSSLLPQITLVDPQGNHLDGAMFVAEHVPEDIDPLLRWWHK